MPQMYWIIPVEAGSRPDNSLPQPPLGIWGGGNMPYPDQGLPGGPGGHPSHPIYHPGHPDHGLPAYPDQGLPGNQPGIDNSLPSGGTEIPSNELPMPQPPPEYADSLIISVKKPGETEWTTKAYDPSLKPDTGPVPHPEPHKRGRRA